MIHQKLLWQMMLLIILLLVGCGTPKTTSNLPTPTPVSPESNPTSPITANPARTNLPLSGELSVAAKLVLGPAEVLIIKVAESATTPIRKEPAQSGMKFILVEFKINKLKKGEEFSSGNIFIEGSLGKQYDTPRIYVATYGMEGEAGSKLTAKEAGDKMQVFFEVLQDEDVGKFKLGYK